MVIHPIRMGCTIGESEPTHPYNRWPWPGFASLQAVRPVVRIYWEDLQVEGAEEEIMRFLRATIRIILTLCYRVKVSGLEYYHQAGNRVPIVANHTSYLDAVLLAAFLPERVSFAVDPQIAKVWWVRLGLFLADFFPMAPNNALAVKSLINYLMHDHKAIVFPEGRITQTGILMKIYQGPGLVADKCHATVLPVHIEGAQYTWFSHLHKRVRLRWFPPITLTFGPPRYIELPAHLRGRARRAQAARVITDMMTEVQFATSNCRRTLFQAALEAIHTNGRSRQIVEDVDGPPLTYNQLLRRIFLLGNELAATTQPKEYVGLLLPNMTSTLITFLALHLGGRVPAMLNVSVGTQGLINACALADIRTVYTSRRFIERMQMHEAIARLSTQVHISYLEDLHGQMTVKKKLTALAATCFPQLFYQHWCPAAQPEDPAVVLFTSGSEGPPKGVVLSHVNLLANRAQVASRVDVSAQDTLLSALPMFHSFGLTVGTCAPCSLVSRYFSILPRSTIAPSRSWLTVSTLPCS